MKKLAKKLAIVFVCCNMACRDSDKQTIGVSSITVAPYGMAGNNVEAKIYTLKNKDGLQVSVSDYGGTIVSLYMPDREGKFEDIALGLPEIKEYYSTTTYFGGIIGRYANRIANAEFSLDGTTYHLSANEGPNTLHGGKRGFDKVFWHVETIDGGDDVGLKLTYKSADGEDGFPGNMAVEVVYMLLNENALRIDYRATTDRPTVINLTNHLLLNLTGNLKSNILGHELEVNADSYLPVGRGLIPTGEIRPVKGTAFDFRKFQAIGMSINDTTDAQIKIGGGYDHCFILNDSSPKLKTAAKIFEPTSGRLLTIVTTEPSVQFYSGNFFDGSVIGQGQKKIDYRYGFSLEPQHYPDSPHHPTFPSTTLRPGEVFKSTTIYRFSTK